MLHAVKAGARRVHPAREDAPRRLVGAVVVDLHEGRGFRRLGGRRRVAIARADGQRRELRRLADRNQQGRGAAGDLVETAHHERERTLRLGRQHGRGWRPRGGVKHGLRGGLGRRLGGGDGLRRRCGQKHRYEQSGDGECPTDDHSGRLAGAPAWVGRHCYHRCYHHCCRRR